MERISGAEQCTPLLLYLDDVIVFSSSAAEHVEHLDAVLGRLQQEGLEAKVEKYAFFQMEVNYLGQCWCFPKKIDTVSNRQRPQRVSELQWFLGFASYYRGIVDRGGIRKIGWPLAPFSGSADGTEDQKRAMKTLG